MKNIGSILSSLCLILFFTGCGALNDVAWKAIGKDGDSIMKELGQAQRQYAASQLKAGEALKVKDAIEAAHSETEMLTEKGVDGFTQSSATNIKKASKGTNKANEILKEAAAKNVKLDENGTKLMAEANSLMNSATIKMGKNTAETLALCIGIKELYDSGEPQNKAAATVLLLPAVTMGSFVLSDVQELFATAKILNKYAKSQGIEVSGEEDLSETFGSLNEVEIDGLPTSAGNEESDTNNKTEEPKGANKANGILENSDDKKDGIIQKGADKKKKLGDLLPKL